MFNLGALTGIRITIAGSVMSQDQTANLKSLLEEALGAVERSIQGLDHQHARMIPSRGEWSVCQLLAHIAEIQGFWSGKAVVITETDNPNITRTEVENDIRSASVDDQSGESLNQLIVRVKQENESAIKVLTSINAQYLDRIGHRGEDNPITAGGVFEYLARHVQEHADQIIRTRQIVNPPGSSSSL